MGPEPPPPSPPAPAPDGEVGGGCAYAVRCACGEEAVLDAKPTRTPKGWPRRWCSACKKQALARCPTVIADCRTRPVQRNRGRTA
eukprot:2197134-Alexandrium_andersonii.AAC.1